MVTPLPLSRRRSFVYKSFGPPLSVLKLIETELPHLAQGWLRVEMSFVPVNPSDLIPMTGAYAHRIALPAVAGYEGVGRVIASSPEQSALIGRRVLPLRGEGTWQTIVDCDLNHAVAVPDSVPDPVAARAYINPLAAFCMLRLWPVRNRTVLLSGAGSSCADCLGHWAIRHGAKRVIGIYRSENRIERMRSLGIEPISLEDSKNITLAAQEADVTFDALGGAQASHILNSMREGAVFVGYGLLTGQAITFPGKLRASYQRFHMREHLASIAPNGMADAFTCIWPLLSELPLPEARIFPAREWRNAIAETSRPGTPKPILDLSDLR